MKRILWLLSLAFFVWVNVSLGSQEPQDSPSEGLSASLLKSPSPQGIRHSFARLIQSDDFMVRYLQWLFSEQGKAFPSQVYPLSYDEIRFLMKQHLTPQSLSSQGQDLYHFLWNRMEQSSTWGKEGYVAIDPVVGVNSYFYGGIPKGHRDWYFSSFKDRPSFVDLGARVSLFDRLYIETIAHIKQDQTFIDMHPNSLMGNILVNPSSIYAMMPQDAYASVSFPHGNLQGGRGKLSWGRGLSGNLLLSDAPGELDYLQISTWWPSIKFTSLWVFLENNNPHRNEVGEKVYYNAGGKRYARVQKPSDLSLQSAQFFLAHRWDFSLGSRMTLSLTEAIIYQDYWNNLAFLNPLYVFHSWYLTSHADYFFSVDVQIVLLPSWQLYTQILLDRVDVDSQNSLESHVPSSLPFLLGTEMVLPALQGYVSWIVEFLKVDPYSYLNAGTMGLYVDKRWLSSYAGAYYGQNGYSLLDRVPLGHYLGNDFMRFLSQLRYERVDFFSVWMQQSVLFKGEKDLHTPWSMERTTQVWAPSGATTVQIVLGLGGEISFSRWLKGQKLVLKADLASIHTFYNKEWNYDLQWGVGLSYHYND